MKVKFNAGAELDLFNRDELRAELAAFRSAWQADAAKGDRYRRLYAYGDPAGGTVDFGGDLPQGEGLGPEQGFVWSVKRLALYGLGVNETARLYINSTESSDLVHPAMAGYVSFDTNQLILYPGDKLRVAATTAAVTRISLTGQVRELPVSLAWRL
jgi:hypothetical protein